MSMTMSVVCGAHVAVWHCRRECVGLLLAALLSALLLSASLAPAAASPPTPSRHARFFLAHADIRAVPARARAADWPPPLLFPAAAGHPLRRAPAPCPAGRDLDLGPVGSWLPLCSARATAPQGGLGYSQGDELPPQAASCSPRPEVLELTTCCRSC